MSAAPASGDRRGDSTTTTQTTSTTYDVERKPRRWLALLALVPLVAGVIETNERIEDDLEEQALDAGATSAHFTAQDGEICADDFDAVSERVRDITGVVILDEGDDCPAPAAEEAAGETAAPTTEPPTTDAPEPTTPPSTEPPATTEPPTTTEPPAPSEPDLVDSLADDGAFGTLVSLVGAAGLEDTLRGDGPITVFAPSDDAFAALDPDLVEQLQSDPDLLASVIARHAVGDELAAADLTTGSLTSLAGAPLDVDTADGVVVVADGSAPGAVVRADIPASNGVIHEIDTVLVPPGLLVAQSALEAAADFDGVAITLTGTVDSEAQRAALVDGALAAAGGDSSRVIDELVVADTEQNVNVDAADGRAASLAGLLAAFPPNTATAQGTVGPDAVRLTAIYLDADAQAALEAAAADAGVAGDGLSLEPRPQATDADRDQLIDDLNALFVDQTIQFAPNSAEILAESEGLLDAAAAQLVQFDLTGITIVIEGHTDSDGDADFNLDLSQRRAEAVEQALIGRGIDGDALDPIGFGETDPIAPNDTDANKALNRRVTFSAQQ